MLPACACFSSPIPSAVCGLDCGQHGSCLGSACVCQPGWSGARCNIKACDDRCNEHGQCINGTCVCHRGFNGKYCGIDGCGGMPNCHGHGECENIAEDGDSQRPTYEWDAIFTMHWPFNDHVAFFKGANVSRGGAVTTAKFPRRPNVKIKLTMITVSTSQLPNCGPISLLWLWKALGGSPPSRRKRVSSISSSSKNGK